MSDANLGDGANGRLSEAERAEVIAAIDCDYHAPSYGECAACGDRVERTIEALERIVREHAERAWDEALAEVDRRIDQSGVRNDSAERWGLITAQHIIRDIRAARQEQNR